MEKLDKKEQEEERRVNIYVKKERKIVNEMREWILLIVDRRKEKKEGIKMNVEEGDGR